jgi:ribosomal protein L11
MLRRDLGVQHDLEAAVRTIAGSARSMGVDVEGLEV